jgi:predicted GIY-YIG superfamily endonuclease
VWLDDVSRERIYEIDPLEPPDGRIGTIYLIHLRKKIGHARHYAGFTLNLKRRIRVHRHGGPGAARLMQVAKERGISWSVVGTWVGTRDDERRLKDNNDLARACPICHDRLLKRKAAAERKRYAARKATA